MNAIVPSSLPYPDFPLRRHKNGQWYKSVWNPRAKRSEQFYFGPWRDDLKGERALKDPVTGWLARKVAIKAGIDNLQVEPVAAVVTLGDLMGRFLAHKQGATKSGDLSKATLGGYLREVRRFVEFMKPVTPAAGLKPEHFTAYMKHLVENRKLGRFARKRVRTYLNTFLRFGAKNGWYILPNAGMDWTAPATDPDSMRLARSRAGVKDYSDRIVTGEEIDKLLARSQPAFKAMILLGVNCGLGPSDVARLRWDMIDLERGRLVFPRPKTGVRRVGYLWKKTRDALLRVRKLKHNRLALAKDGNASLVFITRKGLSYYRETEVHADVEVDGRKIKKLVGVAIENPVGRTFGRIVRDVKLEGVSFYRLRHTFKTLGKKARDREALDLMMGHKDTSTGKVYDHEEIGWPRVKLVAKMVRWRLWPKVKPKEDKRPQNSTMQPVAEAGDTSGM
jgi:integrase